MDMTRSIHSTCRRKTRRATTLTINRRSLAEQRVVVTKDTDFFYAHLLSGRPWKLLLVRTGNISPQELRELFDRNLPAIEAALQSHSLVEIDRARVNPVA